MNRKTTVEAIMGELIRRKKVRVLGFGSFRIEEREPYDTVNPATGKPMTVPAHNVVVFRPSRSLKNIINA